MTVIVEKHTARAVADHYGLDARAFRRWMRRNQNVRLLGTLDSPAMQGVVDRFKLCGSLSNGQVMACHAMEPDNVHYDNEYRGRGLATKSRAIPLKTCICDGKVRKPRANCWADTHNLKEI